ncbi:hypothetical protein HQ529_04515 [Candidatus Woesearchaeota archaeon]|nr:hypothetical protein [Candidatus Woesearchaeota archaeon]
MRKQKKTSKWFNKKNMMTYFIVIIMTFSIAGFLFSGDPTQSERYNDHIFTYEQGLWILENNKVPFHFLPGDLLELEVDENAINMIKNTKMIYTTFNTSSKDVSIIELARFELMEDLGRVLNIYTLNGIINDDEKYNVPVVTCENATQNVPVLIFINNNNTGIRAENNCVFLEGVGQEIIMLKDRIMYGALGVLE